LNEIYASKPSGIAIIKYELDMDKGEVRLQGNSSNRTTLIRFKENLENLSDFDRVEIPISSFEAETNLEFSLAFLYLPISSTVTERAVRTVPLR
jgi:peptidyl-tRNA hydrolase